MFNNSIFQECVAVFGLGSFCSMFLGTAIGIIFGGFMFGFQILVASFLVFVFCLFVQIYLLTK